MRKEYQGVADWADIAEYRGHNLQRDEDGFIDHFAANQDFCNSPACVTCGMAWCEHCTGPDQIKPCSGPR